MIGRGTGGVMAERRIGRGFGRGVFGRAHNGFAATFAASVFTEEAHDDVAFELPPDFEVYIEYTETPSGALGITGVIIRFEEMV